MKHVALAIVLAILCLLPAVAPSAPPPTWLAGAAKVDITPNPAAMPVTLHGYGDRGGKPATGVHDPLYARALVLHGPGGGAVALVSTDLCFVNSEVRDAVVARLAGRGFGEHTVLIAGTHTHSAPSGFDRRGIVRLIMGPYDQRIFDQVVDGVVRAVTQAQQNLRPAVLSFDDAELPDMNRSRRDPAFSVEVGGFDANAPLKPDPEKYQTDRRLSLLRVASVGGRPIALLIHFASHPTVLSPDNYLITADWPGAMNARLEQALGEGAVSLFFNGALGDAAPTPDWSKPEQEFADMQKYGEAMAAAVEKRLGSLRPINDPAVAGHTNRAVFTRITPRPLGDMPVHPGLTKLLYLRPDAPFQAVRIGSLVLLAAPMESTAAAGRELETLCRPGFRCLVIGPANDYLGYLVTPAEYAEDNYQADSCFFGRRALEKVKRAFAPSAVVVQTAP